MFYPAPNQCDIVYGRFPYPPNVSNPGPEPHYCLVLDVLSDPLTDEPWVIVAQGTSQNVTNLFSGEFSVNTVHSPDPTSGLTKPTKFSLGRQKIAKLPYSDEFFDIPPARRALGQTDPKIGVFNQHKYQRAMSAAAAATDAAQTVEELLELRIGLLPPC